MGLLERKILHKFSNRIADKIEPFNFIVTDLDLSINELVERLEIMQSKGNLEHIGPILKHTKVEYKYNALAAWCIPENVISEVSNSLEGIDFISDIYIQQASKLWTYNVYGLVHGNTQQDTIRTISKICDIIGDPSYKVVFAKKQKIL